MRRAIVVAATLAAAASAGSAGAYCPCYTASSSSNTHACGVEAANGTNPTHAEWQTIFDLVAQGPSVWGTAGPSVSDIGQGCGKPESMHSVPARFPCEILKGIAMQESGWRQFCVPDTPADQVGGASRTIISFDCGYGIGQVTSGMHAGESPSFDRSRVASDPTYNLATGTQILASKWKATNCVGDNQPSVVEDWYAAVWAYNGLAYSNNPSNPNYDANRGVWNPKVGGAAPYQEKVFGWIEHAPDSTYWTDVALAYPDPGTVGGSGSPPALPEPSCASPTDCVNHRTAHTSYCFSSPTQDGGAGGAGGSGGAAGAGGASDGGATDASAGDASGWPEAGGAGGGGGAAGAKEAGADGAADAAPQADLAANPGDDGGCSCRAVGSDATRGADRGLVMALVGLAAAVATRRSRKG